MFRMVFAAALAVLPFVSGAISFPKLDIPGLGRKAPSGQAAPDSAERPAEAPDFDPYAPDARAAENPDPGLPWGVVATNSFCYDGSHRRLGTLPGGTPVERVATRDHASGPLVLCKVLWKGRWQEREMWLSAADLILFDGASYSETDRASRDAVLDYCAAWGRYEAAKSAFEARRASANPHAAEYEKAKARHEEMQREVDEVLAKVRYSNTHDLPGGPKERAALLARANELRVEQRDEAAAFAEVRDRWQAWEDSHAAKAVPEPPEMRAAAAEMARLRPAASAIVPGL